MLNFSRLKIGFIISSILIFFYIFLGNGEEICQHHCPIAHVASEFPQLCEAETKAFSEILGTHVQRLATIAHGDGVCTTFIPNNISPHSTARVKEGAR